MFSRFGTVLKCDRQTDKQNYATAYNREINDVEKFTRGCYFEFELIIYSYE